ncbi:MAG: TonB family protein [Flavobacteriia bacterium]|jgi:TonB family protein
MKNIFFLVLILTAKLVSAQMDCLYLYPDYSGFCAEKHKNGKTSWVKEYKNGKAIGTWMYFNEKGEMTKQLNTSLKRDSLDKILIVINEVKEVLISDQTNDSGYDSWTTDSFKETVEAPEEDEVLSFVEEDAQFVGNMNEWISKKLVYPATAKEMGVQGKCYVKFVVEKNGQISNVSVVRGVPDSPECDKEAMRLVKSMPKWKAAKNNGKQVRAWVQIRVDFVLR